MTRALILFVIGLFFGTGGGYLLAASSDATLATHDHEHDHGDPAQHAAGAAHDMGATDHGLLDVGGPVPGLRLTLHPDGADTMNLEIATTGFRFAPERVNGPAVPGEGHAHIYVDGARIARAYGPWFQLTGLSGGEEVRVTLNASSHETLAKDGVPIEATTTVPEL